MNSFQYIIKRVLFQLVVILLFHGSLKAQQLTMDVRTTSGKYAFSYNETPHPLVSYFAPPAAATFIWESSSMPLSGFSIMAGETNATLSFSAPLAQTMYFRRKTSIGTTFFYSTTVKLQLVSVNWENLNYLRQHEVVIPGQTDWKVIDQLPIGSKLQSTQYMDGLGRSIETVSRETATPDNPSDPNAIWGDLVHFNQYDGLARQPLRYLPYTTTSQLGKFKSTPITEQAQYHVNKFNETAPYKSVVFEGSPLSKILETRKPGSAWANAQKGTTFAYEFNTAADEVKIFNIGFAPGDIPVSQGNYAPGLLYKLIAVDEHNTHIVEYYNKAGQLILLKQQLTKTNNISSIPAHNGWICTYNVYDDFGMLRAVIQPEGVKALDNIPGLNWNFIGIEGERLLNEMCFHYRYDAQGRNVYKKAPGAEPLLMLYDNRDRVVMMQDGNQRAKAIPEWTVNLYDDLDRMVISTLYQTNKTISELQSDIDNAQENYITIHNTGGGGALTDLLVDSRDPAYGDYYAAQNSIEFRPGFESLPDDEFTAEINPNAVTLPSSITMLVHAIPIPQSDLDNPAVCTILKYVYYDHYQFSSVKLFDTHFNNETAYNNGEPIASSERTWSMPTGTAVRVLGTSQFLNSTFYYDEKGRAIQSLDDNLKQGVDITTHQFSFDNRLLSSQTRHTALGTSMSGFSVLTKNIFDKIGRVVSVEKKYGDNPFRQITKYDLDDIGSLKIKHLSPQYIGIPGRTGLESLQYSYNIHGMITGINKDYALKTPGQYNKWMNFFGMYLGYEYVDGVFDNGYLSGHVSGILWNTQGDDAQRKYDYTYDLAGRLTNALFNERRTVDVGFTNTIMDFTITGYQGLIEYDLNGNLKAMSHYGVLPGTTSPVLVDDLRYTYQTFTNKLIKVTDEANNAGGIGSNNGKLGDFKDGNNAANVDDYVYDANGNLVIDLNKNIKDLVGVNGIRYNHLDKPEEIKIAGKGVIKLVYDADANKLQKIFTPENNGQPVSTIYINQFVYKESELQYINFEEGRIRVMQPVSENNGFDFLTIDGNINLPGGKKGSFDYFVRDYQSNVRMILTEETHIGSNLCTMENARDANEAPLFGQVDANGVPTAANEVRARYAKSGIPSNAPYVSWTHPDIGNHVSRLGTNAASIVGPNTLMKVMAGDKISASALYFYQQQVSGYDNNQVIVNPLINALISAISGSTVADPLLKGSTAGISTTLNANSAAIGGIASPGTPGMGDLTPKAFLTLLFFDEQFRLVEENSTTRRVSISGNHNDVLDILAVKAPRNGYAFVYVSNESDEHVYFDNIQVTHDRGRLVEENHYYAYGLRIAGISSRKVADNRQGHIDNKNLYNDKELIDEEELDWYDYGFRNYDPQIGRFVQLDPLTDDYTELTPYQYASCEPIANIDIDGLEAGNIVNTASGAVNVIDNASDFLSGVSTLSEVVMVSDKVSKSTSWLGKVTSKIGNFFSKAGKTVVSVGKGIVDGAVEAVKGTVHAITHPIQTLNGIVNSVVNYKDTWKGIKQGVSSIWQTIKSGDPEKIGYMLGKGAGNLIAGGAATKVLSTVGKLGMVSKVMKKLPCGCFTAGTLVLTDSGYRRIEELKVGDTVWAYNDKNAELIPKRVSNVFVFERDTIYRINLGNEIIHATSDHPFFVGGKWRHTHLLKKGDSLTGYNGERIPILGIDLLVQHTKVYNFEVEEFHTYFVTRSNILVHNIDPCDWGKKQAAKGGIQLTKKKFGHTFTTHGDDMTNFLVNRAKGSGMAQGQFLDNQKAAQFILDNIGKTANGAVDIPIPNGFPARIIMPDGTFKAATHIRLVPGGGGVKTAYPLIP